MPVAQTFTARTALAVARNSYVALMERAFADSEPSVRRVAAGAFERGRASLLALEANASDVALSAHAEDALLAYVAALGTADEDAALMWLDLFPEMIRDIRRDADVPVEVDWTLQAWNAVRASFMRVNQPTQEEYRPARRRQPAPPLAA